MCNKSDFIPSGQRNLQEQLTLINPPLALLAHANNAINLVLTIAQH